MTTRQLALLGSALLPLGVLVDKWADYLVSAVSDNEQETHIDKARRHEDLGDKVGSPEDVSRATIVSQLDAGSTFATITTASDGKWKLGATVRPITIDGVKYIRTDADRTKEDNLGELPRFL